MTGDLQVLPNYSAELERAADPGKYVIEACERAKTWLAHALEHGDIEQIAELKSQAEAIRIYTMSKQLGKDAELSAAEIVRRAERGIGLAIRKGQDDGEIRRKGQRRPPSEAYERVRNGRTETVEAGPVENANCLPSPTDFASADELHGNGAGIYHMTDGVTDEQFESAIEEGKTERNLSRANIVRKVRREPTDVSMGDGDDWVPEPDDRSVEAVAQRRVLIRQYAAAGYTSAQISDRIGTLPQSIREIARKSEFDIPADRAMGKGTRKTIDSNRVVRETVHALEGLAMGVRLVDMDDLDPTEVEDWAVSLAASIRVLNRLVKQMREKTQ